MKREASPFDRANKAHTKHCENSGYTYQSPSQDCSGVEVYGGKEYVVLRNNYALLAVYRLRVDGALYRLIRYPAELSVSI